jgi:purine-binding chemotaxis protein CheW
MTDIYERFTERERDILQRRARRAARRSDDDAADLAIDVLELTIRGETYAVRLDAISFIDDDNAVTPVPCVPPFVAGVANIRGYIVPVIDLGTLLGVPGEPEGDTFALIFIDSDDMNVAFKVDAIGNAGELRAEQLTPIPETVNIERPAYLRGALPDGTILLDMKAILSDPALIVDEALG